MHQVGRSLIWLPGLILTFWSALWTASNETLQFISAQWHNAFAICKHLLHLHSVLVQESVPPQSRPPDWIWLRFVACVCLVRLLWALCVYVLLCLATSLFMSMCLCAQLHNELTQPPLWRSPSDSMCLLGNTSCQISPEPPSWSPSRWQRMRRWNYQSPAEEDAYRKSC